MTAQAERPVRASKRIMAPTPPAVLKMNRRSLWALSVLLTAGCSLFVSHSEQNAYRAVRLAQNDDERLVAMASYAGLWLAVRGGW